MSGPRIVLGVLLAGLGLLCWALWGGRDADLERGLEETAAVLADIEAELLAVDPLYREVTRRGLMLNLKRQHDTIRSRLAELRAQRLYAARDESLARRQRLPRLRELRAEAEEVHALAVQLRRQVEARYEFMTAVSPALEEARVQGERLRALLPGDDAALQALVHSLAGSFTELEGQAKRTDQLLQQNLMQGKVMGEATRKRLQTLLEEQRSLLRKLGG